MSSIKFDATLETGKLESSIKQSKKIVKQWAQDVEKAGGQADKGLDKMTKSFKERIKEQKDLVKELEADVKKMQAALDKTAPGKESQKMASSLRETRAYLAQEQQGLISLQKEQIETNAKEAESQNGIISKLKGWALGLATVGAALKIAKGIIDSTESSAHKFEQAIEGAKAGLGYFFKTIASGDWSNFFAGMERAIKGAVEYVDIMEKLNNRMNEQKIKSSEIDLQIAELRDKTYDKDEANNEERKKALTEIVTLQKQKYTDEAKLAKETYEANLRRAASDSGLAEDQIKNFIREYSSLEKLIEIGEEYNELTKLTRKAGIDPAYLNTLIKERNALGSNAAAAGQYVKQIGKITTETRNQLSDFEAKAIQAESAFGQKNRRDKMQLAEVTNKINNEAEAANKKAIEDAERKADLNNQLVEQQKQLEKAITAGNASEIKAIAARIVKLQEELALRERIAQQAIGAAIVRGEQIPKASLPNVSTFAAAIPTSLAPGPGLFKEEEKHIKGTTMLTKKALAEVQKAKDNYAKEEEKADKERIARTQEIIANAVQFTDQLIYQLDITQEEADALGLMTQTVMQLAQGNFLGAALGILAKIIGTFAQMGNVMSEPAWKKQIEAWDALIERQKRVIELSERTGGTAQALRDAVDMAQKEFDILNEQALKYKTVNIFGWESWNIPAELAEMWQKAQDALYDAQQALDDFITGGINQIDIAGVLAQGFIDGKKSARDFAEDFDSLMRQAINASLEELSKPSISAWYKKFAADMTSGGELNADEITALKHEWDVIVAAEEERRKQIYAIAGINETSMANAGLSGAIRRDITEDTGTELAALFRRYADEQRVVKDYTVQGVSHLVGIEANTAETVNQLQLAITELQAINSNTKQPAVAGLG